MDEEGVSRLFFFVFFERGRDQLLYGNAVVACNIVGNRESIHNITSHTCMKLLFSYAFESTKLPFYNCKQLLLHAHGISTVL